MSFTVFEHEASSPMLHTAFKATLPHSIDLFYRTQHSNRTSDAHIIATFSPSESSVPKCWAAAYFDRSMRPETELWMFAAGEIPGHNSASSTEFCPSCRQAVLAMLDYMATLPVPPLQEEKQPLLEVAKLHEKMHPQAGPDARYPPSRGAYLRHMLMPSVVTLGACHHQLVQICADSGLVCPEFPGMESELNKFIFKVSELPQTKPLPEGLRWGEIREKDIATVQARTEIPRGVKTLLSMKSVGVFNETDVPISWSFLGLDGSLTTLHTEPEYRGKGIAKAVSARIFKEYAPALAVDNNGNAWAHADVYDGNMQSETVCHSLGGKAMWKIFWARIDIGKAGKLANSKAHRA